MAFNISSHTVNLMPPESYSISLAQTISQQLGYNGADLTAHELPVQKLVKDATLKFIILDNPGNKLAFVLMSNDDYPDAVALAAQSAQKARQIVGDALSSLVVVPTSVGKIGNNSYAVFPYLMPLRTGKLARIINRQAMTEIVFDWLIQVAKKTTKQIAEEHFQNKILDPLLWLNKCPVIPNEIKTDSLNAVAALEKHQWLPECVFSHNDLWSGNVLVSPTYGKSLASYGIGKPRIIDWLSSSEEGIPGFDLINYANSTGTALTKAAHYLKQINDHSNSTNKNNYFDLLSGFGRLGMNRGEFPLEIYAGLLKSIVNSYRQIQRF